MYHGRNVHWPSTVSWHDERGPAAEDLSADGNAVRKDLARHLAVSRVQAQLSRLCDTGPATCPAANRLIGLGSVISDAATAAGAADQRCRSPAAPVV